MRRAQCIRLLGVAAVVWSCTSVAEREAESEAEDAVRGDAGLVDGGAANGSDTYDAQDQAGECADAFGVVCDVKSPSRLVALKSGTWAVSKHSGPVGATLTVDLSAKQAVLRYPVQGKEVVVTLELGEYDTTRDAGPRWDGGSEYRWGSYGCPGALGCHCATAAECDAGFCLTAGASGVCSMPCAATPDCPPGTACTGDYPGIDKKVCSPRQLCDPCTADDQCQAFGYAAGRCVKYGDVGSFCATACIFASDCPGDYVCSAAESVAGAQVFRCIKTDKGGAPFGQCPCSPHANQAKRTTACTTHKTIDGKLHKCQGVRGCGAGQLTDCALPGAGTATCAPTP